MKCLRPHLGLLNQNFIKIPGIVFLFWILRTTALENHSSFSLFIWNPLPWSLKYSCVSGIHTNTTKSKRGGSHSDHFYKEKLSQRIKGAWLGTGDDDCHLENVTAVIFRLGSQFPSLLYVMLGFLLEPRQPFDTWASQAVRIPCVLWELLKLLWNERPWFVQWYFKDLINVVLFILATADLNDKIMQFGMRVLARTCAKFNWTRFCLDSCSGGGFKAKNQLPCSQTLELPFCSCHHDFWRTNIYCCSCGQMLTHLL